MKKIFPLLSVLLFISCVSTGPFKQDVSGGSALVIASGGVSETIVSRQVDLNENSIVASIKAGDMVKVIKKTAAAALVQLPDGKTGWMDIKFLKEGK